MARSVFTSESVALIRELKENGWNISKIARYIGRPDSSIRNIFRRRM
jgi:hypothetical protein